MAKLRDLVVSVSADTGAYQREMNRMSRMGGDYFKSIEGGAKRADAAYERNAMNIRKQSEAINGATATVAAYARIAAGALATGQLIGMADAWGQIGSRLKIATRDQDEFSAAQSRLMSVSSRVYKDYGQTAELFIRTNDSLQQLGYSSKETLDLVEALSYGLTVSAADSQKAGSAVDSLSKAIQTGKLSMDQFDSLIAAAPRLQKALADSLGVTNVALRQMVAEGKVGTSELMKLSSQIAVMGKEADEMPITVADSFVRLRNEFQRYIGDTNQAYSATSVLTGGINLMSDNIAALADVGGAAAVGVLAGKFIQLGKEATGSAKALIDNTAVLRNNAAAQVLAAETAARVASAEARAAAVAQASAVGLEKQAVARAAAIRARATEVAAINAVTAAQARYNAVSSVAASLGRGVVGALGGPVGLGVTLATVAAGWLLFRDNTDAAAASLSNLKSPLTEAISQFGKLNVVQQENAITQLQKQADEARQALADSFGALQNVPLKLRISPDLDAFKQELAQLQAADLPFDQFQTQLKGLADRLLDSVAGSRSARAAMMEMVSATLDARRRSDEYAERLGVVKGQQDATAGSAGNLGAAITSAANGMAEADWSKYLKNLESARDVIGMTAQQMAVYRAKAEGASEAQAVLAGALAGQTDAAQSLQKATADKDAKAAQGARTTLMGLIAVEAQQRAIIASAQEAARLQSALTAGQLTPAEFNRMTAAAGRTAYDDALASGTARASSQVSTITTNTKPSKSASSAGNDWEKWQKKRQAEIASQKALAQAYLQGGAAVDRATLAKRIEEEVLKQGGKRRAEIVKLLTEEARLTAAADAAQDISGMRQEIALMDARTEAERTLWEVQSGRYAALDEASKKALVASAAELDAARKRSAQESYIGDVNGSVKADETLERMGWLADAFERNVITSDQMQRAITELTGKGDDLTEFARQGARNIQTYLGDGLYEVLTGQFDNIAADFGKMILRMGAEASAAQLNKALFGDFGSGGSNTGLAGTVISGIGKWFGGLGGGGSAAAPSVATAYPVLPSAKGNAFSMGDLIPFAKGGAFTNSIVSAPTVFPLGIMGEAGDEAIMPLHRGPDGSLGVRAALSGAAQAQGAAPGVQVNVIGAPSKPEVQTRRGEDGGLSIDLIFNQFEDRMASNIATGRGKAGKAIERRYGVAPKLG